NAPIKRRSQLISKSTAQNFSCAMAFETEPVKRAEKFTLKRLERKTEAWVFSVGWQGKLHRARSTWRSTGFFRSSACKQVRLAVENGSSKKKSPSDLRSLRL